MKPKIGFIGVGNMGLPMARNLVSAGYEVTVFDKDMKNAMKLLGDGVTIANKIAEVISPGCFVISMVPNDQSLLDIIDGPEGIAANLSGNEIHISMSTVSPETAEKAYDIHQKYGSNFISAPVLGRPEAAESKKLWIFLSGNQEIKAQVIPILDLLGQKVYDFGERINAANIVKLAANFLIISAIEVMGEAFSLIEKNELSSTLFADMITETLFSCKAYKYHAHNIATRNFDTAGFKLIWGVKDVDLLLRLANKVGASMPLVNLLQDRFASSLAKNYGELDWSAITLDSLED